MNTDFIVALLQQPLTMVILGTSMGWLFVTYIWTPYNTKKINQNNTKHFKKELFNRLQELKTGLKNHHDTIKIANLLEGKTTYNSDYRYWKLEALIRSGWSQYACQNTQKTVSELKKIIAESDSTLDDENTKKAVLLLEKLTIYLKNSKEN